VNRPRPGWAGVSEAAEEPVRLADSLSGIGLLAGAANVVMQLSLPPVGYGVLESTVSSGQLFRHPLKRTRTTLTYLAVALTGTDEDRRRYRAAVGRSHAQVRSGPDSPVAYDAFDPDLQLWVAACLYTGVEDLRRRAGEHLDPARAELLYQQGAALGTTLQVRPEQWPADRAAFDRYWQATLASIDIDPPVRAYLDDVVGLRWLPAPARAVLGPLNRFVTTGFLPGPFREAMHYEWSPQRQRRFERFLDVAFSVQRHLPGPVVRFPFNYCLWDMRRRARRGRPLV